MIDTVKYTIANLNVGDKCRQIAQICHNDICYDIMQIMANETIVVDIEKTDDRFVAFYDKNISIRKILTALSLNPAKFQLDAMYYGNRRAIFYEDNNRPSVEHFLDVPAKDISVFQATILLN
jgi:hypothetical protein